MLGGAILFCPHIKNFLNFKSEINIWNISLNFMKFFFFITTKFIYISFFDHKNMKTLQIAQLIDTI